MFKLLFCLGLVLFLTIPISASTEAHTDNEEEHEEQIDEAIREKLDLDKDYENTYSVFAPGSGVWTVMYQDSEEDLTINYHEDRGLIYLGRNTQEPVELEEAPLEKDEIKESYKKWLEQL